MQKNIETLHKILLDIAIQFDRICNENNIPYYMLGGTMLGSIRHKGFIPWDDDMDFGVPRQYYKHLIKLLENSLPEYLSVNTINNSEHIISGFIKIEDTRTYIEEKFHKNSKESQGLNIDIFPLDYIGNSYTSILSKNWQIEKLLKIQNYLFLSYKNRKTPLKQFAKICQMINIFKKEKIINSVENKIYEHSDEKKEYIANIYGAWGMKEIMKTEIMGKPTLYEFENIKLYGVEKPSEYLTALYNNYMELPPKNKQHTHIFKFGFKEEL